MKINTGSKSYTVIKEQLQKKLAKSKKVAVSGVREVIAYAQYALNPPKREVLSKKAADMQKKYLQKHLLLSIFKKRSPEQQFAIAQRERELAKLEQSAQKAVEKYNKFLANEQAAQKAFDNLNK